MATVTVYEKPTCTTCRKLIALLAEHGVEPERIDYHVDGLTEAVVRDLLAKTGLPPHELLRRREPLVKERGLGPDTDPDELVALMVEHPALLQRPVVVVGDRAVLARPIERALELLEG
ncbi:MAG: arsenate reductase [Solirubrobacteraceae bacterium]|nr:arsenate reductase [Solirubrobacteraceae bacterium]